MTSEAISIPESLVSQCRIAQPRDAVYNTECVYSFHSPFTTESGLLVNLNTFVGTRQEQALMSENSSSNTSNAPKEGIFVRIVKSRVPKAPAEQAPEEKDKTAETQPTKLGVGVEGGFATEEDQFEITSTHSIVMLTLDNNETKVTCEVPYTDETQATLPEALVKSVESVLHHAGTAIQQDLKVWELDDEPKPISKYAADLPFVDNGIVISPHPHDWKCQKSGDTENLWLNLSDGYIGGGRQHWDGSGGSNGALDHFNETNKLYPLVVKLGTITADTSTADCYSYAPDEDGPVQIPNLDQLLEKRGIHVSKLQKTVKSTAELEVELNTTYAFDAITEAGAHLQPVSGPGFQGLQNLGNSCYLNSVVQLLLSGTVPELAHRYAKTDAATTVPPPEAPQNLTVQTQKLASALVSGEFASPTPDASAVVTDASSSSLDPKYRLQPRMFKHVVAGTHCDFSTGQQQDAAQFLQHLLEQLDRAEHASSVKEQSSHLFSFGTTSRLVCQKDNLVKYKESSHPETIWSLPVPMDKATVETPPADDDKDSSPAAATEDDKESSQPPEQKRRKSGETDEPIKTVTFQACCDAWAAETTLQDYRWPHLHNQVHPALQTTRLHNFPRYLLVQIQRYQLGADWTPVKLEVNLDIPQEIDLDFLKSKGPQPGENLVPPEDEATTAAALNAAPAIDERALSQLVELGFSLEGCKRALLAVGGSDVEAAMNWVFEHNQDPDFNDPLPEDAGAVSATPSTKDEVDEGVVMSLVENLGCFTMDQVRAALKETNGAADRAADWLFSHMDDLDGAIASLHDIAPSSAAPASSSVTLEDGPGKYSMAGMISHIGKHTGSGHYVAHLKRDDKWVIFNDEKVALSESPPFAHAYVYLFQRNDTVGSPHEGY